MHNIKRHWYHMTFLPCVAHKNSAKLVLFQNTIAFGCNLFHLFEEILYFKPGQIPLCILTVLNNICIGRMCANQIYAFVLYKTQISCITFAYVNLTVGTFMFKVNFLPTSDKRRIININANNNSV